MLFLYWLSELQRLEFLSSFRAFSRTSVYHCARTHAALQINLYGQVLTLRTLAIRENRYQAFPAFPSKQQKARLEKWKWNSPKALIKLQGFHSNYVHSTHINLYQPLSVGRHLDFVLPPKQPGRGWPWRAEIWLGSLLWKLWSGNLSRCLQCCWLQGRKGALGLGQVEGEPLQREVPSDQPTSNSTICWHNSECTWSMPVVNTVYLPWTVA